MKTIEHNGNTYHVNGMPEELKQLMSRASTETKQNVLFEQGKPMFFYNHKNFQGDPMYLSDAVEILKGLKQPTKTQVRNAMIWGIGYGGDLDYAVKAGGETNSDNMFSSHLSVTIAHPKTGMDTNVVVLKKYSKNFEDVLITEQEVRDLYKMCQTPDETKKIQKSQMEAGICLLLRSFRGQKINISGKQKKATQKDVDQMKEFLFNVGSKDAIEAHIDKMISRRKEDLKLSLNEELSSRTTKEFHADTHAAIEQLQEFKVSILGEAQAA